MISWKNHTILKQMLYFVLEDQPLVNYLLVDYKRLELTFSNCWSPDQLPECETKKIFFCLRLKSQRSTFWITHSFKLLVFFFPLLLKIIKSWLMAYLTSYDPFYFFFRWLFACGNTTFKSTYLNKYDLFKIESPLIMNQTLYK